MSTPKDIIEVEQIDADGCNKRLRQGWKFLGVFQRWHDGESWAYPVYVVGRGSEQKDIENAEH